MNVEERLRLALIEDAAALEVPPLPALSELERRSRRTSWRWALIAVTAGIVAVALIAGVTVRSIVVDDVQPASPVSFDPGAGDVFANGEVGEGVRWTAAAGRADGLPCVGVLLEGPKARESTISCTRLSPTAVHLTHTSNSQGDAIAVAGWVSDEVSRLVWQHPDGPVEIDLQTHGDMPRRVFAAAAPATEDVTIVEAYNDAGEPLGGAGVRGTNTPAADGA